MVRVGLIGAGAHGSRYANHIVNDLDSLELAGMSRRSPQGREQAELWNTEYFQHWQELVQSTKVDAIIAVTPPVLNLEIAKFCAAEGKPLLIEKPLARNAAEAEEIVKIMDNANCQLTVGQTLRYNPVIQSLKDQLPSMGKLHSFTVNQRLEPSSLPWHDDPEIAGAGVIIHTAIHIFDALKVVTRRKIVKVTAAGQCIHANQLEDLVTVIAEFDNGTIGNIDVSKVGHARSGRYEFVCQEGQLAGDQVHAFTNRVYKNEVIDHKQYSQVPTILSLLADWIDFLKGNRGNPVAGEDGLYAVQVCEACIKSMREREWVTVRD